MSIIGAITPDNRTEWLAAGGVGAGGAVFSAVKGGPSVAYNQAQKEKKAYLNNLSKFMDDFMLGKIPPQHVHGTAFDMSKSASAMLSTMKSNHSPSPARIATYAGVGLLGAGVLTAAGVNLIQSIGD